MLHLPIHPDRLTSVTNKTSSGQTTQVVTYVQELPLKQLANGVQQERGAWKCVA